MNWTIAACLCGEIQACSNGRGMFRVMKSGGIRLEGRTVRPFRAPLSHPCSSCREVKLNGCNKCFGVADVPWPAIKREHRGGTALEDQRGEQMEGGRTMSAHYRH